MFCTKCGASYKPEDAPRFCRQCGAPLRQPAAPAKAPPQQQRAPAAARQTAPRQQNRPAARAESGHNNNGAEGRAAAPRISGTNASRGYAPAPASAASAAPAPAKQSKKWLVFAFAAIAVALAALVLILLVLRKDNTGSTGSAVNAVQMISGAKKLSEVRSCDFDLLANDGATHVTGTVTIADDFQSSAAIVELPEKDGQKSYAYLHEGRLMLVNGTDYITGANIQGLSEVFQGGSSSALDSILSLLNIDTGPLTYDDCVTLFNAMREAAATLASDEEANDRLHSLCSIAVNAAVPLLKLRNAGTVADENKDAALALLEEFFKSGASKDALQLSGEETKGQTVCTLTITPAVFFRELVAFCKTSADFKTICDNLQTTPEEALSAYTDEALNSTFGENKAVLLLGITDGIIDSITLDYADRQIFTLTLSNFDTAAVNEADYEFIENMRTDPNVENAYIDNYIDILKQLF